MCCEVWARGCAVRCGLEVCCEMWARGCAVRCGLEGVL